MGRQYVKYKNKWAVFSSVSDGFITRFMTEEEINKWREKEYGTLSTSKEKAMRSMEDALYSIRLNRTHKESVEELIDADLNEKEAEKLIDDLENKYYKPKEREGKYYCPNCGSEVMYLRYKCNDETCDMELIWRLDIMNNDTIKGNEGII